jgi:hypothetical protein
MGYPTAPSSPTAAPTTLSPARSNATHPKHRSPSTPGAPRRPISAHPFDTNISPTASRERSSRTPHLPLLSPSPQDVTISLATGYHPSTLQSLHETTLQASYILRLSRLSSDIYTHRARPYSSCSALITSVFSFNQSQDPRNNKDIQHITAASHDQGHHYRPSCYELCTQLYHI